MVSLNALPMEHAGAIFRLKQRLRLRTFFACKVLARSVTMSSPLTLISTL